MTKNKKIILEFLIQSNAIENVFDEVSILDAYFAWQHLNKFKKLSTSVLNKAHSILMHNQPLREEAKGQFRKCAVYIGGREGKPWYVLPELMEQWVVNANDVITNGQHENETFLERIIKEQHVAFETIHPYEDGNGRCGRLVMNWTRIMCGLPILVIYEAKKSEYYSWFE